MEHKENQCNIAEKDASFGVLHTFRKRMNVFRKWLVYRLQFMISEYRIRVDN